jgi:hypothetical protein
MIMECFASSPTTKLPSVKHRLRRGMRGIVLVYVMESAVLQPRHIQRQLTLTKQKYWRVQPMTKIDNTITFSLRDQPEETMKLENGWFWYRGEKIEDIHKVYERMVYFLNRAEATDDKD